MTADDGMTRHPLPHDMARCHDKCCAKHPTCRRWIDRKNCGDWTSHYTTMGTKYGCNHYIEDGKYAKFE